MLTLKNYKDPFLRRTAKPADIKNITTEIINEMTELMYANRGIGIAAPQVGISERYFIYEFNNQINLIINPVIIEKSDATDMQIEGCLSIPNIYESISRPVMVRVKYIDLSGNEIEKQLFGLESRIFQHEYDHLDGKFFIDYLSLVRKRMLKPHEAKTDQIIF
ncbi:MAG: peptide deformylase [Candidatus Micrarchaeaceae archaeon]